jgi:hypothetical protein
MFEAGSALPWYVGWLVAGGAGVAGAMLYLRLVAIELATLEARLREEELQREEDRLFDLRMAEQAEAVQA